MASEKNNNQEFSGDKKSGKYLLYDLELKMDEKIVHRFPRWIETYHLTLLTLVWSLFILFFSYLARENLNWLWAVSLMIFFQYITDHFDGKIGKYRNTGLIKWGYYMDHFLDFIFLGAIIIGYMFIFSDSCLYFSFILLLSGAFMVNSFLFFSTTNEFHISYFNISATEARIILIILNILIIFFGINFLKVSLPYVILFLICALIAVVFNTQKKIWKIDMDNKNNKI